MHPAVGAMTPAGAGCLRRPPPPSTQPVDLTVPFGAPPGGRVLMDFHLSAGRVGDHGLPEGRPRRALGFTDRSRARSGGRGRLPGGTPPPPQPVQRDTHRSMSRPPPPESSGASLGVGSCDVLVVHVCVPRNVQCSMGPRPRGVSFVQAVVGFPGRSRRPGRKAARPQLDSPGQRPAVTYEHCFGTDAMSRFIVNMFRVTDASRHVTLYFRSQHASTFS